MTLFESFGEILGRAMEALPAVAIEHIHDVEEAPDVLEHSVHNQFGVQSEAIGSAILELAGEPTPETVTQSLQPEIITPSSETNLDAARNEVDAAFAEIFEINPDLSQGFQDDFTLSA